MRTALIDSDSLLYISLYNKKGENEKTLDECKGKLDVLINNILSYTHADSYILTLTIGKNFRYSVRADYKADRKIDNKPPFFKECRNYLIEEYGAIYNENLESDDLVNIYNKCISGSFICACDSDILYGLDGNHFDYKNFKWVKTNKEESVYKFWHDMIAGTHNGIKGIPGKGTKYVEKIMNGESNPGVVLNAYLEHFKEEGVEEFYRNYMCLKIKDKWDELVVPEPRKFERKFEKRNVDESTEGDQ